jgi:hypothetical protein
VEFLEIFRNFRNISENWKKSGILEIFRKFWKGQGFSGLFQEIPKYIRNFRNFQEVQEN